MKISSRGRYALRLMIDLAQQGEDACISLKDISRRQEISAKYLEQIVTSLTKSGLIRSVRGNKGGYMLSRAPSEYTAGEILRSIEGKLSPVACLDNEPNLCSRVGICQTIGFWQGLYSVINQYVDSVTLEDLAANGTVDL